LKPDENMPVVRNKQKTKKKKLKNSSVAFFDSWIWDPGGENNPDPGSGINIPDNFSESLETVFWLIILNSLMQIQIRYFFYPGSGMEKLGSGIRQKNPGSATQGIILISAVIGITLLRIQIRLIALMRI
jgi:hypothetical protein